MTRTILLALAALAGALAIALPAGAAVTRRCGTIQGEPVSGSRALILGNIRATGTTCRNARSIARSWRASSRCGGSRTPITTCAVRGYACRQLTGEGELTEWRCRKATATVRFRSGA
jgi:hypothetical protein